MNAVSSHELRKFGLMMAFVVMGLIGLAYPLLFDKTLATIPFVIGTPFLFLALTKPSWLKWVYTLWMKIGHVLGYINSRIILGIIFFIMITPIGIIMRLVGNDPMNKCYNKNAATYRKKITPPSIKHMEKPF